MNDKVALLMGGWSAEREISLKSGGAVLSALQRSGIDVEAIDVDRNIVNRLRGGDFQRAFNMLHGRDGEDGTVQALLELLEIPYTGSGVAACAIAMDKMRSKMLWQAARLPTPKAQMAYSESDCESILDTCQLPFAVKPVLEGSSVGITKVKTAEQLSPAWHDAQRYGEVMVEEWIEGKEYTVAVLDGEPLPSIRLQPAREFYDYVAKYDDDNTQYHCPSGLSVEQEQEIQQLCIEAFSALGCSGWGRVDLMLDDNSEPWLIEVNTVPGMTDHSLVPMAAKAAGIEFDELVLRILAGASLKAGGDADAC